MLSIRFMLGAALGFAGGYSVARAVEARAMGVPLDLAFKQFRTPVTELRKTLYNQPKLNGGRGGGGGRTGATPALPAISATRQSSADADIIDMDEIGLGEFSS